MAPSAPGFVQRMLMSKMLGELVEFLPESARDALIDLRDYVQKHGRLPKFEPVRTQPIAAGENAQAIGVLLAALEAGGTLRMVNLLKGEIRGGSLRGVNAIVGEVQSGEIRGGNMIVGNVHGGLVRGLNVLLGDVHGGEVKAVNVIVGAVHGGDVKCQLLIGDIHGGKVVCKLHLGRQLGGDAQVERTL